MHKICCKKAPTPLLSKTRNPIFERWHFPMLRHSKLPFLVEIAILVLFVIWESARRLNASKTGQTRGSGVPSHIIKKSPQHARLLRDVVVDERDRWDCNVSCISNVKEFVGNLPVYIVEYFSLFSLCWLHLSYKIILNESLRNQVPQLPHIQVSNFISFC